MFYNTLTLCAVIIIVVLFVITHKPYYIEKLTHNSKPIRVVASLTTRPQQPYYFSKVLDNLVKQFDAVYLALPRVSCKGIPYPSISHPGVTIIDIPEDYGPITKYFGALHESPETLVVVVDDDILYPPTFRVQYEHAHRHYPRTILSGAGIVYKYACPTLPWYASISGRRPNWTHIVPSYLGCNLTNTVAGYSGVAFKRNLIKKDELLKHTLEWSQIRECFINDDIVISAYFAKKRIPRLCIDVTPGKCPKDKDTESLSISDTSIQKSQYKAFTHMKDCFTKDPTRWDVLCATDIVILIIIITIILKYTRK